MLGKGYALLFFTKDKYQNYTSKQIATALGTALGSSRMLINSAMVLSR